MANVEILTLFNVEIRCDVSCILEPSNHEMYDDHSEYMQRVCFKFITHETQSIRSYNTCRGWIDKVYNLVVVAYLTCHKLLYPLVVMSSTNVPSSRSISSLSSVL